MNTISPDKKLPLAADLLLPFDKLIVEVGCANGNFFEILKNHGIKPEKYYGIDISKKQINKARKRFPRYNFKCLNIEKDWSILKRAGAFVAFQTLEHIGTFNGHEDELVLQRLRKGTKVVISIPNSPYRKEHKRWFEIDGWRDRYSKYIDFDYEITVQNVNKKNKRSFLFRGYRK